MDLQIQCPECSRRFHVHEDLTGKTVECGACDQRFKVTPETVIENRDKFYPGEHHDALLDRLGKKPPRKVQSVSFAKAEYSPDAQADAVIPATAGQKIAVMTGIVFFFLYTLVFLLGSSKGSVFQDVELSRRLILAGFVSLISSLLIVFGAKGWRARSVIFSLFLTGCLIALVFIMPIHILPSSDSNSPIVVESPQVEEPPVEEIIDDESEVKKRIDFSPMQREIDRLTDVDKGIEGERLVTGIFIEDIDEIELLEVQQFLQRKLDIPKTEAAAAYQRNGGKDRLIVFSGIPQRFETFVTHCEFLGEVKTHPAIRVIEVELDKSLFANPSRKVYRQMTDPRDSSFFLINLEQLRHVSLSRIKQALERLANLPSDVKAREIPRMSEEFIRLLREETDPELISNVGKALKIWAKGNEEVVSTVGQIVSSWNRKGRVVPRSLVEFLADNGSAEAALVIDSLWAKNPEKWTELYSELGSSVEDRLLFHLQSSPNDLKKSALTILRRVGTDKSLSVLETLKAHDNDEIQILAVRAISSIEGR